MSWQINVAHLYSTYCTIRKCTHHSPWIWCIQQMNDMHCSEICLRHRKILKHFKKQNNAFSMAIFLQQPRHHYARKESLLYRCWGPCLQGSQLNKRHTLLPVQVERGPLTGPSHPIDAIWQSTSGRLHLYSICTTNASSFSLLGENLSYCRCHAHRPEFLLWRQHSPQVTPVAFTLQLPCTTQEAPPLRTCTARRSNQTVLPSPCHVATWT